MLRKHLTVLIPYTLIALGLSWPLALNLATAIPGIQGDAASFVWAIGWAKTALADLHVDPFHADYVFYPLGGATQLLWAISLIGVLAMPLQSLWNLAITHNLLYLAATVLTAYGTYLLATEVLTGARHGAPVRRPDSRPLPPFATFVMMQFILENSKAAGRRSTLAPFAAGLVFAFAPLRMGYGLAFLNLFNTEFIPFYVLCLLRATRVKSWRMALLAGFLSRAQCVSRFPDRRVLDPPDRALCGLDHDRVDSAGDLYACDAPARRSVVRYGAGLAARRRAHPHGRHERFCRRRRQLYPGLCARLFRGALLRSAGVCRAERTQHALWRGPAQGPEHQRVRVCIGRERSLARPAGVCGLRGPGLGRGGGSRAGGGRHDFGWAWRCSLRFPGWAPRCMLQAWTCTFRSRFSYGTKSRSSTTFASRCAMALSSRWRWRCSSRSRSIGRKPASTRARSESASKGWLLCVPAPFWGSAWRVWPSPSCRCWSWPRWPCCRIRYSRSRFPRVYETLARVPGDFTVLEIPSFNWRAAAATSVNQAIHHKRILRTYTNRIAPGPAQYMAYRSIPIVVRSLRILEGIEKGPLADYEIAEDKRARDAVVQFYNLRYAVVHRALLNADQVRTIDAYVRDVLGARLIDDDGDVLAYEIPPAGPAPDTLAIDLNDNLGQMYAGRGWQFEYPVARWEEQFNFVWAQGAASELYFVAGEAGGTGVDRARLCGNPTARGGRREWAPGRPVVARANLAGPNDCPAGRFGRAWNESGAFRVWR